MACSSLRSNTESEVSVDSRNGIQETGANLDRIRGWSIQGVRFPKPNHVPHSGSAKEVARMRRLTEDEVLSLSAKPTTGLSLET